MSEPLSPDHFSLEFAIRPNILDFPRYSTPTSDHVKARPPLCLDANENAAGSCLVPTPRNESHNLDMPVHDSLQGPLNLQNLHRYPSAAHATLRERIAQWRELDSMHQVGLGSGASDIIDVLVRMTCAPGQDKIMVLPPTFELYKVCATLHGAGVQECVQELTPEGQFCLPMQQICTALSEDNRIKVIFIASPGNPTGSLVPLDQLQQILELEAFKGLVVVDEAYIDFASAQKQASALQLLPRYNNLIVVQSLSKSHGLAGIRVGMAMAHPTIIQLLLKVQMPYKLSSVVLELAERALSKKGRARARVLQSQIMVNREYLVELLSEPFLIRNGIGHPIGGHAANFVLVPILRHGKPDNERAKRLAERLRDGHGVAIRFVGGQALCDGCLRITVGTTHEIQVFRSALRVALLEYV
ncbi:putative histidinol-phosphate transaminase [Corynespora cassiicola Philippines]|uniref:histidinol-phosphate transaminase n=1 Tax=Corynespora cassiicola Philippines TaxID=1448308 RepID=A0A2T2NXX8_CORCC|nr:putative histidinol-phosphate transaminase [Corynespora cassiicola Philippines]